MYLRKKSVKFLCSSRSQSLRNARNQKKNKRSPRWICSASTRHNTPVHENTYPWTFIGNCSLWFQKVAKFLGVANNVNKRLVQYVLCPHPSEMLPPQRGQLCVPGECVRTDFLFTHSECKITLFIWIKQILFKKKRKFLHFLMYFCPFWRFCKKNSLHCCKLFLRSCCRTRD